MFIHMLRNAAGFYGPGLDAWQSAARFQTRLIAHQYEAINDCGQFFADRLRAYAETDSVESLNRRLESLTEQFGKSHLRRLTEIQALWGQMLVQSTGVRTPDELFEAPPARQRETAHGHKAA